MLAEHVVLSERPEDQRKAIKWAREQKEIILNAKSRRIADAPMTEKEMLTKLKTSREQGTFRDADQVISDMRSKYGL